MSVIPKLEIHEKDLTLPTLKILSDAGKDVETTELIKKLEYQMEPKGKDQKIIEGRQDTHFSQKVRNLVCHRKNKSNPIAKGWIEYCSERNSLKITKSGYNVLAAF